MCACVHVNMRASNVHLLGIYSLFMITTWKIITSFLTHNIYVFFSLPTFSFLLEARYLTGITDTLYTVI